MLRRLFLLLWLGILPGLAQAQEIPRAQLPPEAHLTLDRIKRGGPFPYRRDGIVFGNYEQRLPLQPRGYYREYTVAMPEAKNRGARRIVCGGRAPRRPDGCWYSADHYRTFRKILE